MRHHLEKNQSAALDSSVPAVVGMMMDHMYQVVVAAAADQILKWVGQPAVDP